MGEKILFAGVRNYSCPVGILLLFSPSLLRCMLLTFLVLGFSLMNEHL